MPPWWIAGKIQCWAHMVDKWCVEVWEEMHNSCRERPLMMPGAPHHQGNITPDECGAPGNLFLCSNAQFCITSNHLAVPIRHHMMTSLDPSSRHGLWPTRARQCPMSTTTQWTHPRHTAMRPSTAASVSTAQWQGRSMGRITIRAPAP